MTLYDNFNNDFYKLLNEYNTLYFKHDKLKKNFFQMEKTLNNNSIQKKKK